MASYVPIIIDLNDADDDGLQAIELGNADKGQSDLYVPIVLDLSGAADEGLQVIAISDADNLTIQLVHLCRKLASFVYQALRSLILLTL